MKPSRLRVRTSVRAPGVRRTASRTSSSTDSGRPASVATRACRLCAKSSSPRIAESVTAATSAARPACVGEELDDLVLDEGGVHVHDDEPAPAPRQPGRGHRDVGAHGVRDQGEVVAQVGDVGARDVELHGRHGVARQAADAVDVRPVLGDRGRHRRDLVRLERSAHDDDGGPAGPARGVVTATDLEVHPHPHALAGPDQPVDEDVLVTARREQDREGEVARGRRPARGRAPRRRPSRPPRTAPWSRPGRSGPLRVTSRVRCLGVRQRRRGRVGWGEGHPSRLPSVGVPPCDEVADRTPVVRGTRQPDGEQPGADGVQGLRRRRRSRRRPRGTGRAWRTRRPTARSPRGRGRPSRTTRRAPRACGRSCRREPKPCQMSACWATIRSVLRSPPPPMSTGMSRVGARVQLGPPLLDDRQVAREGVEPPTGGAELVAVLGVVALEPPRPDARGSAGRR